MVSEIVGQAGQPAPKEMTVAHGRVSGRVEVARRYRYVVISTYACPWYRPTYARWPQQMRGTCVVSPASERELCRVAAWRGGGGEGEVMGSRSVNADSRSRWKQSRQHIWRMSCCCFFCLFLTSRLFPARNDPCRRRHKNKRCLPGRGPGKERKISAWPVRWSSCAWVQKEMKK
jgi:hypothetical protein